MEKSKDYYSDEGLEEFQDWFATTFGLFEGNNTTTT